MHILVTSIVDVYQSMHLPIHEYIDYLSRRHEITVISICNWWKARWNRPVDYESVRAKVLYVTKRRVSPIVQELLPLTVVKRMLSDGDFFPDVHLNYSDLFMGYVVGKILGTRGVRTVYVLADDVEAMARASTQIPYFLRNLAGGVARLLVQKNIKLASKVVVITKSLRDHYFIPESKSYIVPNGVDVDSLKPCDASRLRRKYNLAGRLVVGYLGALREWVDLDVLFSGCSSLDFAKIVVVGEEGRTSRLSRLVNDYGLSEKIVFTGMVPYHRVPEFISMMDVCVVPFKINNITHNSFPLKLLEYMACEKPVICTPLRGVQEAVGDKVLYAKDAEQMRDAITRLYEDRELRLSLGREGREFVEANYSWQAICERLEDILTSSVN